MDSAKGCPSSIERVLSGDGLSLNGRVQSEILERPASLQEEGLMSPPPRPYNASSRPLSLVSRPGSRLSLSLPVQIVDRDLSEPKRQARTSSELSTRQASPSLDVLPPTSPNNSSSFLVALAAQERKVFELKEELHRAEGELKKLKRQWALHEANPNTAKWKKTETKNVETQPMQTVMASIEADNGVRIPGSVTGRRIDLDRRRATFDEHAKDSRRKVITGGHTRALSLLSPTQQTYDKTLPSRPTHMDIHPPAGNGFTKANLSLGRRDSNKTRHSYQDSATIGVKQIAEDIKSGLWTFMEDLRQATVGDEAIKGPPATRDEKTSNDLRRKAGKRNPAVISQGMNSEENPTSTIHQKGEELWHQRRLQPEKSAEIPSSVDDNWSNWDSPTSQGESTRWSDSTNSSYNGAGNVSGLDPCFKTAFIHILTISTVSRPN
jgi:Domain of unknown function (DUF4048)